MIKLPKKILIEFNGKTASLLEHCKDLNISYSTVRERHQRTGEPYDECLKYYQENGVRHIDNPIKDKRLYSKWYSTKLKCEDAKHPSYKNYGARGIKVCERWQNYKNFEADMYESFIKHVEEFGIKQTTIERLDYNGDYEPSNCTWATYKEQANNRCNNRMITEDLNVTQFAEKYNMEAYLVLSRLNAGWSVEEIINIAKGQHKYKYYLPCNNGTKSLIDYCNQTKYNYRTIVRYIKEYNLEPHEALAKYLRKKANCNAKIILPTGETLTEFSKRTGISRKTLESRIYRGWSLEKIVNTPLQTKCSN